MDPAVFGPETATLSGQRFGRRSLDGLQHPLRFRLQLPISHNTTCSSNGSGRLSTCVGCSRFSRARLPKMHLIYVGYQSCHLAASAMQSGGRPPGFPLMNVLDRRDARPASVPVAWFRDAGLQRAARRSAGCFFRDRAKHLAVHAGEFAHRLECAESRPCLGSVRRAFMHCHRPFALCSRKFGT